MEIQYVYQKKRSEFGRQCRFSDKGPELVDNYRSNKKFLHEYILRDPVDESVQCTPKYAHHDLNTTRALFNNGFVNHTEGGWPKDVNLNDEEQTKRYRRKVEKDENYNQAILDLCQNMENSILQNNSINLYQQYFSDVEATPLVERSSARTLNVYQDQSPERRPVTHISWSPDAGSKVVVSYCNLKFQSVVPNQCAHSYIWDVANPNRPLVVLKPLVPLACIEYNPKDPNSLVSGQFNGQVAIWDIRRGSTPVELSIIEKSHRDPVQSSLWINSKSGAEFFSSSSDGQIKWWDTRKMTVPLDTLILDPVRAEDQSMANALGASCLEYESTIPTRFMVGTEPGFVLSCNRKGKTPLEMIVGKYSAHLGPVLALQRNPAFSKNFLTVGDWSARIFSEDCKESPIMWTPFHRARLTDGAWSATRCSVFFTTRSDGILDLWDILQNQKQASLGVKVCDDPLSCLRTHDMGRLVAIGNAKGTIYLVEFSENLSVTNKNDRPLLTAMFDRESRREKILEGRYREIRLKHKTKSITALDEEIEKEPSYTTFTDPNVIAAEKEFYDVIDFETKGPEPAPQVEEEDSEIEPEPVMETAPAPPPATTKAPQKGKGKKKQ